MIGCSYLKIYRKCENKLSWNQLWFSRVLFFSGVSWKFVPSKFRRPPKEFLIYGNEIRQTTLDNFLVPVENLKKKSKGKRLYQSRITKYFKWNFCIFWCNKHYWKIIFFILFQRPTLFWRGRLPCINGGITSYFVSWKNWLPKGNVWGKKFLDWEERFWSMKNWFMLQLIICNWFWFGGFFAFKLEGFFFEKL